MRRRTVLGVTFSRLIGFMFFLILLMIANLIQVNSPVYSDIINFLNMNLGIIVIFSIFFYLGELFFVFVMPFNLPAPIFNAIGGIVLVNFLFRMLYFIGDTLNQTASFSTFRYFEPLVYFLVFFIIIVVGYIRIFTRLGRGIRDIEYDRERVRHMRERMRERMKRRLDRIDERMERRDERREERMERREDRYDDKYGNRYHDNEYDNKYKDEWKDVGDEFRKTAHTVVKNISKSLEPEKKEKKPNIKTKKPGPKKKTRKK